jgi:hypothetical protein
MVFACGRQLPQDSFMWMAIYPSPSQEPMLIRRMIDVKVVVGNSKRTELPGRDRYRYHDRKSDCKITADCAYDGDSELRKFVKKVTVRML